MSSDGWQAGSRIASGAKYYAVEQAIAAEGEEEGRLDLTLEPGGKRLWFDVAVVNVMTINATEHLRRAISSTEPQPDMKRVPRGLGTRDWLHLL